MNADLRQDFNTDSRKYSRIIILSDKNNFEKKQFFNSI